MKLTKDNEKINQSNYDEYAKNIFDSIMQVFKGGVEEIENNPHPSRNKCVGFTEKPRAGVNDFEKRICKCLYYYNNKDVATTACDTCVENGEFFRLNVVGDYKIINYEVPPIKKAKGVGNVDILLTDDKFVYPTEVKPFTSEETLLRMISEIITYCEEGVVLPSQLKGRESLPIKLAIAFFEGSNQDKAFHSTSEGVYTKKLIKLFGITVFKMVVKGKTCEFIKLN
ncbi:MAG: hypothetical protein E7358_03200 [Clostridiales bacterium]|nr:hypothetical protein [Clostridiales bacterium]